MIDPLSAAGLAYPIAKDLCKAARKLRKACHHIQHAKKSLEEMIDRTETVAETYELFSGTMADAKKIRDVGATFKKHRKLINNIEEESKRIIDKLKTVTRIFTPLLQDDYIDRIQRWITQFEWYRKEKNVVAPVLLEMQILEQSMNLIATLIIIKMLQHNERKAISGRDSILVEIKHLSKSMDIGFKKLQDDKRAQEELLKQRSMTAEQDASPVYFAQEILRVLKKEIPKLHQNQPRDSPSTPDSGPSSSSPAFYQQVPSTPPSSPPRPSAGDLESVVPSQLQEVSTQGPEAQEQQQQQPQNHPLSESPSPPLPHLSGAVGGESELESKEDVSPQPGPYVRMPPFAQLTPSSSGGDQRVENRMLPCSTNHSGQRIREPYSGAKRQNGSRISAYGNDGEVTHTHLTGSAGLPPGWQRRRGESPW
ncbi:uncharacterized protein BDV17DRAFT_297208 [Aspergillus undulatus]|uniref:uncharacterized protein n=1 Tax=Aspergillus undulatus TaxID=1810928 RepID=UPI003CCCBCA0